MQLVFTQKDKKPLWTNPLSVAQKISSKYADCVFLYSGQDVGYSGQYSILAFDKKSEIKSLDFTKLEQKLTENEHKYDNSWFGYLGYGLKNALENLPQDAPPLFNLPDLYMINFHNIIIFNHYSKEVKIWSDNDDCCIDFLEINDIEHQKQFIKTTNLSSNFSKQEYFDKVQYIKQAITDGELSQANLTRKFSGEFAETADNFQLFQQLCQISPSAYSAYIQLDDIAIISSSPEQFLTIQSDGYVETRPIKGSSGRCSDSKKDLQSLELLKNSEKDKSENLMIVDLMRNDLSRTCEIGSVKVNNLFETVSYPTVHHMYSLITGQKSTDKSTSDMIKSAFPAGSMTGTPKIKAMEICSSLEKEARGVYSGAIGWFGGDGSADLSVVIRTIISDGNKFEFQVGGAIVADSTADSEWDETMIKASAIIQALNIDKKQIQAL